MIEENTIISINKSVGIPTQEIIDIKCECGCGQNVKEGNRFIYQHHLRGKILTKEHKRKDSEALRGRKIYWVDKISMTLKGKPKSEAHKHKIGLALKNKPKTEEHKRKLSEVHTGVPGSELHNLKVSLALKGKPKSNEHLRNMLLGFHKRPTSLESALMTLFSECGISYKYTGGGKYKKYVIGGKCPDFALGDMKLIDAFGEYWHKPNEEQPRIEHFRDFGYELLIVWGKELGNKQLLSDKLLQFTGV